MRFIADLAATKETERRVAGFFECLLPALGRRYDAYLAQVDVLLDGPSVQILERIKFDLSNMAAEGRALIAELPAVKLVDTAWLDGQRRLEASINEIVAINLPAAAASAA